MNQHKSYSSDKKLPNSVGSSWDTDDALEVGQFIPLHYHFQMLLDSTRLHAFRSAIEATVKPGMRVVELGGGTGILSSFAARCGARVVCVEANPEMYECAERLIRENGWHDRVEVVLGDAAEYLPAVPVDAVVCEMLHVGLLREKQIQVIEAFKRNYISLGHHRLPRFLPEASRLMFQLVDQDFLFSDYYAPIPVFQAPSLQGCADTIELSSLIDYAHILYDEPQDGRLKWSGKVRVDRSGNFSAIRFVTQNAIAIEADKGEKHPWANQLMVLPIDEARQVEAGEYIDIDFQYRAGDSIQSLMRSLSIGGSNSYYRSMGKAA